jgi:hypothetical protein
MRRRGLRPMTQAGTPTMPTVAPCCTSTGVTSLRVTGRSATALADAAHLAAHLASGAVGGGNGLGCDIIDHATSTTATFRPV